jgi:hydroxyacylglutathione hydrolase
MTANLPDRPAYFAFDVNLNLEGAEPFSALPPLDEMSEEELKHAVNDAAVVLDVRSPDHFGAGHFPGSLNIGLGSPSFSTWTGFMVPGEKAIVLVVGGPADAERARLNLARIGFDNLVGYIPAKSLSQTQKLPQRAAETLKEKKDNGLVLVDVRTPNEWNSNHIDGARHLPLATFAERGKELPNDNRIAVICGSGYRSSIAASLLQARGYEHVENVTGGMSAYLGED